MEQHPERAAPDAECRLTYDEVRAVAALAAEEEAARARAALQPTLRDVAEGLDIPLPDAERLLRRVRSREAPRSRVDLRRPLLVAGVVAAVAGLSLSAVSHVAAVLGLVGPLGGSVWGLHIGGLLLWIPVFFLAGAAPAPSGAGETGFLDAFLAACPAWMRTATAYLLGYVALNFLLSIPAMAGADSTHPAPPPVVRLFSGAWIWFYWIAFVVFTAAARRIGGADSVTRSADR